MYIPHWAFISPAYIKCFRGPDSFGVVNGICISRGEEAVFQLWDTDIQQHLTRDSGASTFVREIDLARILSAQQGVQLQYPPFQHRSFVVDALRQIISFGLGSIPGVGTLLAISFNVGWELIENPNNFRDTLASR